MAKTFRITRAYVLHGRASGVPIDYEGFFTWVSGLERQRTRVQVHQDLVLAIAKVERDESRWRFRFISGNPGEIPLVYDDSTGEVFEEDSVAGRWRATATRVTADPTLRLVAIEQRRVGVGSVNLERYFSRLAEQNNFGAKVSLEMNPLPSPSFEHEIDELSRIRQATIDVRRPNTDWNDADDILSSLADESGAHRASVTVNASRGETLTRDRGIMSLIVGHLRRPLSNVENVRVTGTSPGSDRERTVSLTRHQLQDQTAVPTEATMSDEDESIFETQDGLLERGAQVVAELSDLRPGEVFE